MNDKLLQVDSCPLCRIFTHGEVKTKLYWPEKKEDIPEAEFVIVDCTDCKIPLIILNEHITEITRECWGRILYRCRKLFGGNVRLRTRMSKIRDHIHFHVISQKH